MQIGEIMNRNVTSIRLGSTMREAAEILSHSWASDLMVVDDDGCFVGVLSEGDLIRAVMPRFEEMMLSSENFRDSFELFVDHGRETASQAIDSFVIRHPITFGPGDEAVKAAATMVAKNIRRLPIVEDGRLVGSLARPDICLAVIK